MVPNVTNVCSECEHLLEAGESRCADHPDAWVLAISEMRETELVQGAYESLCKKFKQGKFSAYPAWVGIYCARTLHLWCSAIEGNQMKQKTAWVPSIPIVSQGIVTGFWVKKGKVFNQGPQETLSSLVPVNNYLSLQTRRQVKHEGFVIGRDCQVCGRLQIWEGKFLACAEDKVGLPEMCWHLTNEHPTTRECAVRSTVTIGN